MTDRSDAPPPDSAPISPSADEPGAASTEPPVPDSPTPPVPEAPGQTSALVASEATEPTNDDDDDAGAGQFQLTSVVSSRRHVRRGAAGKPLARGAGIVVCVDRSRVVVFEVDARGPVVIARVLSEKEAIGNEGDRDSPTAILTAFGEALEELPRSARQLHVILSEPYLSERLLHLPKVKDSQIQALVAAAARSNGTDKSAYRIRGRSFQDGREGLAVEAVFAQGRLLDGLDRTAQSQGCWIKRSLCRPAGGNAFLEVFADAGVRNGRFLMLEVLSGYVRLSLVDDHTVRFFRMVDLGGAVRPEDIAGRCITEVQRTNIFMGSRFRERPADRMVILGRPGPVLEAVTAQVGGQFDIEPSCVPSTIKTEGELSPLAQSWVHDAAALIVSHNIEKCGAINLSAPVRDKRQRVFLLLPAMVVVGLAIVAGAWAIDRNARLDKRNAEHRLSQVLSNLDLVPASAKKHTAVLALRATFQRQVSDLQDMVGRRNDIENILRDLSGRLPRELFIVRIDYRAAVSPVMTEDEADTSVEAAGPIVPNLAIEGRLLMSMVNAPKFMKKVVAALKESPYVAEVLDESGRYDPFQFNANDPVAGQFPVVLLIDLKENS